MKQEIDIKIYSTQVLDNEKDAMELSAQGTLYHKDGKLYISYKETEHTGYQGCSTIVKVESSRRATITRYGAAPSQMVIAVGEEYPFAYNTGYGTMDMTVSGRKILLDEKDKSGQLVLSYTLGLGPGGESFNDIRLKWKVRRILNEQTEND